jgi:2-amino-4-hydroxy-6-hydroxymethyldihydropteridine diphosphokinase
LEYADWAPTYRRIQTEFAYPFDKELASAHRLKELLPKSERTAALPRALERLAGRRVVVVGLAPAAGPPPLHALSESAKEFAVVAADGATVRCLEGGIVPDVIVTDLDGPVAAEVSANVRGSLAVVHAHGDNLPNLEEWVPQFPGRLAGSWAGPPEPELLNVGGFTDGDRAVFLAEHARAREVLLFGFDFDTLPDSREPRPQVKRAKLRWARELIGEVARRATTPVSYLRADGSRAPFYPSGPSTQ